MSAGMDAVQPMSDKNIKLMLVIVILLAFIILSAITAVASMSNKYNVTDIHTLNDLMRDNFSLLMIIVVFYFGNSNDQSRINDMMQKIISTSTIKPVNIEGDQLNVRQPEESNRRNQSEV